MVMVVLLRSVALSLSIFFWMVPVFCAEPASDCQSNDQLCIEYQKALSSYQRLKYLEENQLWDDYFANGNTYRQQIEESAQKVVQQAPVANSFRLKSRLLLWQFHLGQQDAFVQTALDELAADTALFAKESTNPELLKSIADSLIAGEEKTKARQIYKLYVDQLTAGQITDAQLKNVAAGFYKEGNLDLAQAVYDIYLQRVSKTFEPGKFIKELFETASLFVYKKQGLYDMGYAEKIYAMIDSLGQKDAFNQETIYLRAFNLEKFKDYQGAEKLYLELIRLYPETRYFDEAVYKAGMINAYALANINEARKYFQMLAVKDKISPHVLSSLYQLGLLVQWEGSADKAKEYYELLLKNAADGYAVISSQAKDRLKELQENKQLDYNLKTFLDLSLKSENALVETGKAELESSNYLLDQGQQARISSLVNMPQSGCNQVQLQYLWSGDLEGAVAKVQDSSLQCSYSEPGTKTVNIVIISPAGTLDRSFTMMDVY